MKKINQEELNEILKLHELWLDNKEGGVKADLRCVDLRCVDLRCADLKYADLRYADLRYADLTYANLRYTDLTDANLRYTDLACADLRYANLRYTNLINANLINTGLTYSDLTNADLTNANLINTDLRYANLRCTDLTNADLTNADLTNANLINANLINADLTNVKTNHHTLGYHLACPEEGSFIGYKKADNCLVKLLILEDSKRSSATSSKCRCDKAKVLEIINLKTNEKVNEVVSDWDYEFIYKVGEIVKVDNFDEDRWNECSTGIHFFMNKENAINYGNK